MIIERNNEILVTAITESRKDRKNNVIGVDMHIPDFGITVHGDDFLPVFIRAEQVVQAIHESYVSKGITISSSVSNDEAHKMCVRQNMCVIFLQVKFSGGA